MDQEANRPESLSSAIVMSVEGVDNDVDKCTRPGCRKAADGVASPDLCRRHRKDQRRRAAEYMARKRADWKACGRCTRCGALKRAPKSMWCAGCLIETGKLQEVDKHVDNRTDATVVSRSEADGFLRRRYHGKMRKGAPSIDDQDDFERRIVDDHMRRYRDGMDYLASSAGRALSKPERDEARFRALGQLAMATRAADEIIERHRYEQNLEKRGMARVAARAKKHARRQAQLGKAAAEFAKSGR